MDAVNLILGFGVGIMLLLVAVFVVVYVLSSIAYVKALKFMGYANPWMAWIPYLRYYGLMDCLGLQEEETKGIIGFQMPLIVVKLWFLIPIAVTWLIPGLGYAGTLISTAVRIAFLGFAFGRMYAAIEGRPLSETKTLGYVSGWMEIIAVIKFLGIKNA